MVGEPALRAANGEFRAAADVLSLDEAGTTFLGGGLRMDSAGPCPREQRGGDEGAPTREDEGAARSDSTCARVVFPVVHSGNSQPPEWTASPRRIRPV